MANILIVEDERSINELLNRNLTLVGHSCSAAFSGEEALEYIAHSGFDLILLDIMLPKLSGFDIMAQTGDTPVIFLTALDTLDDRVKGLNLGADDYIVKPFETLELLARVQAVLRRTQKEDTQFVVDDVVVDIAGHKAYLKGEEADLAPQEFELLRTLIVNRNIALSRDKLLELAWGYDYAGDTRTVDVHIQKLRKKLNFEDRIKTVFKLGYRLEV